MRRIVYALLILVAMALPAEAQELCIRTSGEEIPARHGAQIVRTLLREVEFYGPLGLQDTVSVNLKIFKDSKEANVFIRQYVPEAYGDYCSGMFIPEAGTAVLCTTEDMGRALQTIFHEISHALYDQIMGSAPLASRLTAYSLNEGLACYFEFMNVRKDGTVSQKPDPMYVNTVKTLIEIDEFHLSDYLRMNDSQFKYRTRSNGHESYYVSYVIVATLFKKLGIDGMRNLLEAIISGSTYEESVETLYPGGTAALGRDIVDFVR